MKIGIYLLQSHHTFLFDFIKIMESSSNDIHLFISKNTLSLLKELDEDIENKTKSHLFTSDINLIKYNKYVSKVSKELDFFVLSPLFSRKGLFSQVFLNLHCKYVIIEVTFGDVFINHYGFFHWDKFTNNILKTIYKRELNKADGLWFSSRSIIQKIKPYISKNTLFIPFNFYDETKFLKKTNKKNKQITITITGGIEEGRKDYKDFLKAVNLLIEDKSFDLNSVKFISLGSIKNQRNNYGKSINKQCREINEKVGFELIKTFEELYISESVYRDNIEKTDIILNPINLKQYKFGKFNSGMSESIAFAIPGIYPKGYEIVEEIYNSSLFYNGAEDLYNIIKNLSSENINSLSLKAIENSKLFSFERYSELISKFIEEL